MLCDNCNFKASVLCCNIPYCDSHFSLHFERRGAHSPQQLSIELDPLEQNMLNSELKIRIKQLEDMKLQMIVTLKVIIDIHNSALSQIIQIISDYKELLNFPNFMVNQIEDIQGIIKTQMVTKQIK